MRMLYVFCSLLLAVVIGLNAQVKWRTIEYDFHEEPTKEEKLYLSIKDEARRTVEESRVAIDKALGEVKKTTGDALLETREVVKEVNQVAKNVIDKTHASFEKTVAEVKEISKNTIDEIKKVTADVADRIDKKSESSLAEVKEYVMHKQNAHEDESLLKQKEMPKKDNEHMEAAPEEEVMKTEAITTSSTMVESSK